MDLSHLSFMLEQEREDQRCILIVSLEVLELDPLY